MGTNGLNGRGFCSAVCKKLFLHTIVWEKSEATKGNSKIFIQSEDKLEKFLLGCVRAKIDDFLDKEQQL